MAQSKRRTEELSLIKLWLDSILHSYNRTDYVSSDPIEIVHSYQSKEDQEIVALITALFSFGNITSIKPTVRKLLEPLSSSPRRNLEKFSLKDIQEIYAKSYYRFYSSKDIQALFAAISSLLKENESIESIFSKNPDQKIAEAEISLQKILHFRNILRKEISRLGFRFSRGLGFMFADPYAGTAKRWHMFLRWMIRKDQVDLGIWNSISPAHLIVPLDTHVFQIASCLKFTNRKSPSCKTALEVTQALKIFDSTDPLKYDFALCRIGVLRQKNEVIRLIRSNKIEELMHRPAAAPLKKGA